MDLERQDRDARQKIQPGADLVERHLKALEEMVKIDSRSFAVNEFEGDRKTPSDMAEILDHAKQYLEGIGFQKIVINQPLPGPVRANPILMAEIPVSKQKPTVLFYAHLDKQPYMDDEKFEKWGGVAPTELRWNEDKTRAYGRGAADDLSGVVAIGMTIDALLQSFARDPKAEGALTDLPCNIKIIFETEEESGSHTLVDQILQNKSFFESTDCVIITDVINPAQGVPGLTTSLRGIIQLEARVRPQNSTVLLDAQAALYKLLATLINEDHSIAVEAISRSDDTVTEAEVSGYRNIPTTVDALRTAAGLLPDTRLAVPHNIESILIAQLRKSFANSRPGHRVSGSIIFGAAGARLTFDSPKDATGLQKQLQKLLDGWNRFDLKVTLASIPTSAPCAVFDLIVQAADKDPHSGMHGGPFPVAELQLAQWIDRLVNDDGTLHPSLSPFLNSSPGNLGITLRALRIEHDGTAKLFDEPSAQAIIEVRLAPGNEESAAHNALTAHLRDHLLPGFGLELKSDKGSSPWITPITHPVYSLIMDALEIGYEQAPCLFGCGGSIPFVPKLTSTLGGALPICLGPYDPDSRMHEPGESLSMPDLLGCSRSMVHFLTQIEKVFLQKM